MAENTSRQHRHHKQHRARRRPQSHASGGGRPIPEESGLQLPQMHFAPYLGNFFTYPKGWTFNGLTPGRAAFLAGAGGLLVIVACLALAKLIAG